MTFTQAFRLQLLRASLPIVKVMGSISAPFSHKKVSGRHYYHLISKIDPGTVLITRTSGEFSNLMIPGHFSHAAMYVGEQWVGKDDDKYFSASVTEAVGSGTRMVDLVSFLTSKDEVLAFVPRFASSEQMQKAADWTLDNLGVPYDFVFEPTNEAFYCSEYIQKAYAHAIGKDIPFTKRKTLGVNTVIPQDYVNATSKWLQVWDSKDVG